MVRQLFALSGGTECAHLLFASSCRKSASSMVMASLIRVCDSNEAPSAALYEGCLLKYAMASLSLSTAPR